MVEERRNLKKRNAVVLAMSLPSSSSKKKITLTSSDGKLFEVEEAVARQSQTIKHLIEDGCADNGIPVPNVTSKTLAKVIEYCRKHADEGVAAQDRRAWDAEFVRVDQATLFDIIMVRFLFFISIIRDYRFLGLKVVILMEF